MSEQPGAPMLRALQTLRAEGAQRHNPARFHYLEVLARATTSDAGDVLRGMQQVLAGVLPEFRVVYPCHSPTAQRWFAMTANPLLGAPDRLPQGAVVTHVNITPWVGADHPAPQAPGRPT